MADEPADPRIPPWEEIKGPVLTTDEWQFFNRRRSHDDAKRLFDLLNENGSVTIQGWTGPAPP